MRWRLTVVVLIVVAAATACAIPMADLGGARSVATAINDAGVVVGVSQRPDGSWRAFERIADDTVIELSPLPGAPSSGAVAINNDGVVVGSAYGGPGGGRAVSWAADGTITDLGPGRAIDINDDGMILIDQGVVVSVLDPAVGYLVPAPVLPDAAGFVATAINEHGQVVGWQHGALGDVPVRWDVGTGELTDLSATLSGPLFRPVDINDRGTILGTAGEWSDPAIVLAGTTDVVSLGAGANEQDDPYAYAVNESDTVVGFDAEGYAFRWHPTTGLVRLPESSSVARDLNDTGTVVGSVNHKAAFLVFPQTP